MQGTPPLLSASRVPIWFVATLVFLATELESTDVSAVPAGVVGAKTPVPSWMVDG